MTSLPIADNRGEAPFGWRFDSGGRLLQDKQEQEILSLIRECLLEGHTLDQVADVLRGG